MDMSSVKSERGDIVKLYWEIAERRMRSALVRGENYQGCPVDIDPSPGFRTSTVTLYRLDPTGRQIPVYSLMQTEAMREAGLAERREPKSRFGTVMDPRSSLQNALAYWDIHWCEDR
jgi:hypothetical protein